MQTDENTDPDPAPAPKPARRPGRWRFWLRTIWILCLIPVVFSGVVFLMVLDRDLQVPVWLTERLERRAAEVLNGGALEFGAITLRIGRDLHLRVRATDTQLHDANGALIGRIPAVEAVMSPRGLILQRDVLVQNVQLTGAQINLRRDTDGSVAVAFGSGTRETGQARSLIELLDASDTVLARPALEALETVRVTGLVVNFEDARAGQSWIVDGGSLSLDLREDQTTMRGDFALLTGTDQATTANVFYTSARGSLAAEVALNVDNVLASDIASQSPAISWLRDVRAPMSAALRTELDEAGALGPLNATLEIGQGAFQPNPGTPPVEFDAAKAYLTYDPARDRIRFDQIEVETDWGGFAASGDAYLREIKNGFPGALLVQLQMEDVGLNPAELYEAPLTLPSVNVDLRARFAPFSIEIGQLTITEGRARAIAHGHVAATDDGWQVAMDADLNHADIAQVLRYWPQGIKSGSRAWVENSVKQARMTGGSAGFRIDPGQPARFATSFGFAEAEVKFLRSLPAITDGVGTISIADKRFVVAVDEGRAVAPLGGQLDLAGSSFMIPRLEGKSPAAQIDLTIDSTVTAALSVLNQPPFAFMDKANLPVALADGRAQISGQIRLPLMPVIPPDDIDFAFDADLRSVRSAVLVPDRDFAASRMQVSASREAVIVRGPIRLGQVPFDVEWSKRFDPATAGQSTITANVALSPAFLQEFGIALPPGTISGRGSGDLQLRLRDGQDPAFTLSSDMVGIGMAIPPLGWEKAPQAPVALRVSGQLGAVPRIEDLSLEGAGLRLRGDVTLTGGRQLETARFSQLQVGDWFNAPLTLRGRGADRTPAVEIDGGRVDLRRARFGAGSGGAGGPVQLRLDQLQITDGIALRGFEGDFDTGGGFSGQFAAQINGVAPIRGSVAPRQGRSAVRIVSEDAGAVGRATGLIQNGVGGALDLTLLPTGGAGTFDGRLAVRGLRVRDAPAMAALLDAISVVGLLQQLDGQGLAFDTVDAAFRLTPSQVIVTEASAVGPGLGISVDGIYTLAGKQLDLQGVVSPFYLVNSIGSFLTRRGEGLIGFNFNIGGTADGPAVTVNPLSALTPGMFREIFRRAPPEVSQ